MQPSPLSANQLTDILDFDGRHVGTYLRTPETPDGPMMLIGRDPHLGGRTILVSMAVAGEPEQSRRLAYGELSVREAPQYSLNVPLHAYFAFWKRIGTRDFNRSMADYAPTGSGPVGSGTPAHSGARHLDTEIQNAVGAALQNTRGLLVHLNTVGVRNGTVVLEGFQNDTSARLRAAEAAASVPGVREVVNMLVIRALL